MSVTSMTALLFQVVAHCCLRYRLDRGWLRFFASGGIADRLRVRMHPVLVNPIPGRPESPPPALAASAVMDFVGRLD